VLFNPLFNFKFLNFFKSGFYIDFFLKKIAEIFVKNIFIYSSFFFAEKFLIEFLTKKCVDNFILKVNSFFLEEFNFNFFFSTFFIFFFYFFFILEVFFIFF
jgi:hypothetical protein